MRNGFKWVALVATFLLVAVAGFGLGRVTDGDRDFSWDGRMMDRGPGMMRGGPGPMGQGMGGPSMMTFDEEEFLNEMVAHHEEAVEAAAELARSGRPTMRAFGEKVVRVQSAQVEQMTQWLERWYGGPSDVDYRPMMRDLSELDGNALDRAFLVDMIHHHRMAVMMSQHALLTGDLHPAVADLARDIRDDQRAEILQMTRWLQRWFGGFGSMMWMHRA